MEKKILHYFWWPLKKSISERIQNQLRVCKCPDKNLRYHQKWRWLWFFGSSKFEYLSWSPEKKSSASIDHTPDRTYENTLESIKTFHISRWKPDLCQFSLLSKNIHQMTVFTNYLSCLQWNAQSVSMNFTTQYGAYTWGTSKFMYLFQSIEPIFKVGSYSIPSKKPSLFFAWKFAIFQLILIHFLEFFLMCDR